MCIRWVLLFVLSALSYGSTATEVHKKKPVITLAKGGYWYPYAYEDESGKLTGIDVELLKRVSKRINYPLTFTNSVPRKRLLSDAKKLNYNVILAATYTEQRSEDYYFSIPYRSEKTAVFYFDPALHKIKTLTQLMHSDFSGALNSAGYFGEPFETLRRGKEHKLMHAETSVHRFELLLKQRVDYIVGDSENAKYLSKMMTDKPLFQSPFIVNQNPVSFIFLKSAFPPEFIHRFNAALEQELPLAHQP